MSTRPALPMTTGAGLMVPFMSARRRHEICDIVFEQLGGVERLAHEAGKDSDAYWQFMTKLWGKGLPRATSTEHSVDNGVETLLEALDKRNGGGAKVINGDFVEVSDADD